MKFDGYDAIIDDDGSVIYDGLDSRSADIIMSLMDEVEALEVANEHQAKEITRLTEAVNSRALARFH